jgi:hypothetical protein
LALAGFASLVSACSRKPAGPKVHPVKGRFVLSNGGSLKPLADRQSAVQFESVEHPGVRAIGDLQEDGSFTVTTFQEGVTSPGAVEGSHRVRLLIDEQATEYVSPQFERFETSGVVVKVPSEQEIVIKVWP